MSLEKNILSLITDENLKNLLTQTLTVYKLNRYIVTESTVNVNTSSSNTSTSDTSTTKSVVQPKVFKPEIGTTQVQSITFYFDIFSEVLDYNVSQTYENAIDETFLKAVKTLSTLTNFSLVDEIQNRFYQKYISPQFKTKVEGKDTFNIKIPVYLDDIKNLSSLQKLVSVSTKQLFSTSLVQLKTNEYLISLSFLNGKINIKNQFVESLQFEFEPIIQKGGKLFKQNVTISSKLLYMDVPTTANGKSVSFLNGSNYIFSI